MSTDNLQCWNCGGDLTDAPRPISRHETCPACFEALHCCRLCEHFRAGEPNQCAEDRADPPANKENANFCEWFLPTTSAFQSEPSGTAQAKGKLDALFGGGDPDSSEAAVPDAADAAKARLDSLFRKQ